MRSTLLSYANTLYSPGAMELKTSGALLEEDGEDDEAEDAAAGTLLMLF